MKLFNNEKLKFYEEFLKYFKNVIGAQIILC